MATTITETINSALSSEPVKLGLLALLAFLALDIVNGGTMFADIIHVALGIAVLYVLIVLLERFR